MLFYLGEILESEQALLKAINLELKNKDKKRLTRVLSFILNDCPDSIDSSLEDYSKRDLIENYLKERHIGRAENTFKNYKSVIGLFLNKTYPKINKENVIKFLDQTKNIWSINTKRRNFIIIKNFLIFLKDEKLIEEGVINLINVPSKIKVDQYVPNDEDIERFLKQIKTIYKDKDDFFRFDTIFKVYIKTGIRLNELININREDIDFEKRKITLRITKNKDISFALIDDDFRKILKRYLEKFKILKGPVFIGKNGRKINKNVLTQNFNKIRDKAKLSKRFTIHGFRRYFIDKLRRLGTDLFRMKELARHKDINTTYSYCKVDENELLEAISKIKVL